MCFSFLTWLVASVSAVSQGTVVEEAKIKAAMAEATSRLGFECSQVLQTSRLEANEQAAKIEADTAAKVVGGPWLLGHGIQGIRHGVGSFDRDPIGV